MARVESEEVRETPPKYYYFFFTENAAGRPHLHLFLGGGWEVGQKEEIEIGAAHPFTNLMYRNGRAAAELESKEKMQRKTNAILFFEIPAISNYTIA